MPSLQIGSMTQAEIHQYLHQRDPSGKLLGYLLLMDRAETWVVEKSTSRPSDVQGMIARFSNMVTEHLGTMSKAEIDAIQPDQHLVQILGRLHASKAYAVMDYLNTLHPGFFERIIIAASAITGSSPEASILLRRVRVLFRTTLTQRVYTQDNIRQVISALASIR